MTIETSSFDLPLNKKNRENKFRFEEKIRQELSETKSCFLTLYNEDPYE